MDTMMSLTLTNDTHALTTNAGQNLTGSFQQYLNHVNSLPILSQQEEIHLFEQYQQNNDLNAVKEIIQSHLRFVAHIARGYHGYGLPLEDLVQEGNIGLMKSVKRFNLSYGVRFVSFAVHWIKAEIHEFVIKNWRLVKIATTKAQRKLFFNLRKMKQQLGWMNSEDKQKVAEYLDVDVDEVTTMETRLYQQDAFFDESFGEANNEDPDSNTAAGKYLEDKRWTPENTLIKANSSQHLQTLLTQSLSELDAREYEIITARWLTKQTPITLHELATKFGVSNERVRQIEQRALAKIKKYLMANEPELTMAEFNCFG